MVMLNQEIYVFVQKAIMKATKNVNNVLINVKLVCQQHNVLNVTKIDKVIIVSLIQVVLNQLQLDNILTPNVVKFLV